MSSSGERPVCLCFSRLEPPECVDAADDMFKIESWKVTCEADRGRPLPPDPGRDPSRLALRSFSTDSSSSAGLSGSGIWCVGEGERDGGEPEWFVPLRNSWSRPCLDIGWLEEVATDAPSSNVLRREMAKNAEASSSGGYWEPWPRRSAALKLCPGCEARSKMDGRDGLRPDAAPGISSP